MALQQREHARCGGIHNSEDRDGDGMELGEGTERGERCADEDLGSECEIVEPFYEVVLTVFGGFDFDYPGVETACAFSRGFGVLCTCFVDVDANRFSEFREVVVVEGRGWVRWVGL